MDWQAEELLKRQRCYEKDFVLDEEWLELVKKFSRKRKLTKEMADAFVEKIVLDHRHHVEIVLKYDDFLKELMELAEEGKEEAVGSDKH
jgi:uncharacterized protein YeeX (DUF496 family)